MKNRRKKRRPRFPTWGGEQNEGFEEGGHLRQGLHHSVQQCADPLGHLEEFENSGNSKNSHHSDDGRIDGEYLTFDLFQCNPNDREENNCDVKLVPSEE